MGERDLARQAVGRPSSRATSCGRSTRATARSAPQRGARSAASPKAATAPSTSRCIIRASSRSSRAGRATSARTRSARSSASSCSCSPRTTRGCLLPRVAPLLRKAPHVLLVLLRLDGPVRATRTRPLRGSSRAAHVAHHYFRVYGGHNWAIWRACARRLPRRAARLGMVRHARASSAFVLSLGDARRRDRLALRRPGPCHVAGPDRARRARARRALAPRERAASPLPRRLGRRRGSARACSRAGPASTGSLPASCSPSASSRWHYALNGVSILVVRQIPAHEAFHAAAAEQAVAMPAVLAGIAGAVLARPGGISTGSGRARSLALLVACVGLLGLLDAVFPEHRQSLVSRSTPRTCTGSRRRSSRRSRSRSSSPREASRAGTGAPGRSPSCCSQSCSRCTSSGGSTTARSSPASPSSRCSRVAGRSRRAATRPYVRACCCTRAARCGRRRVRGRHALGEPDDGGHPVHVPVLARGGRPRPRRARASAARTI